MSNTRRSIRRYVEVSEDLKITIKCHPFEARLRTRDGYAWVELLDEDMCLVSESHAFGCTGTMEGINPPSIQEHVAQLIEAAHY